MRPELAHIMQVVYGHLDDPQGQDLKRGVSYLKLRPGDVHIPMRSPQTLLVPWMSTGSK